MTVKEYMATKLFSGRLYLTIFGGVAFLMIVNTVCDMLMTKADSITVADLQGTIAAILLVVSNIFTFYFTRTRKEPPLGDDSNGNGNGDDVVIDEPQK